ncbi:hypothetical protein ACB092_11G052900 [Castanea dentata]
MDPEKEEFLKEFGADYGYPNGPKSIDQIRATEFKRLDGLVYLDHAGSTLYSELQMEAVCRDLTTNVYGNPHSQSDSSSATCEIVREARQQVLEYFNASPKDYKCIFTSGASAALKLVGEAFPWSQKSCFMYTMENHNSVLGIREYALSQGAAAFAVDIEETVHHGVSNGIAASVSLSQHQIQRRNEEKFLEEELIECNFSGLRFSLDLVKIIKEDSEKILEGSPFCNGRWMVLVDAAKGCATEPPDLSKYPVDFVVISFYKIFGYPTGLGALIARNDAAKLLKKTYFSGGTVAATIADIDFVKRREGIEELFEDGTAPFLSIASIRHGFKILNSLTISAIGRHTAALATYLRKMLLALRHENGASVCKIYKSDSLKVLCREWGPIVSFNLKRPDGSWFGYREVEKLSSLSGIQLRTGCFCNPGACAKYLGLSHLDLRSNMEKFIDFVKSSFVSLPNQTGLGYHLRERSIPFPDKGLESRFTSSFFLKSITIYPIKSCAGFSIERWPLSISGLRYDHEWLLKSLTGEILTQKKLPEMCLISTSIDLHRGIMFVESPRCKEGLQINLKSDLQSGGREEVDLYGQRYEAQGYSNEVNNWFSLAIGRTCCLLRYSMSNDYLLLNKCKNGGMRRDMQSRVTFANEAQFLLISEESVSDLNKRISSNVQTGAFKMPVQINPMRFRPNLVISGGEPYVEDEWRNLKIGNKYFTSLGGCNRCQMINIVHTAGRVQKSNEPLATLASYRRSKGKILFGILLRLHEINDEVEQETDSWLQAGQEIHPNSF